MHHDDMAPKARRRKPVKPNSQGDEDSHIVHRDGDVDEIAVIPRPLPATEAPNDNIISASDNADQSSPSREFDDDNLTVR